MRTIRRLAAMLTAALLLAGCSSHTSEPVSEAETSVTEAVTTVTASTTTLTSSTVTTAETTTVTTTTLPPRNPLTGEEG